MKATPTEQRSEALFSEGQSVTFDFALTDLIGPSKVPMALPHEGRRSFPLVRLGHVASVHMWRSLVTVGPGPC